tara:strand:- start:259 stop:498 length:240 start_codon:yes stop_codon:yes gene_type:complete
MGFCCQEDRPPPKDKQDHKENNGKSASKLKRKKTRSGVSLEKSRRKESPYKSHIISKENSLLDSFNTPSKSVRIESHEI